MKNPLFPADGSSPCVVVPKITHLDKCETWGQGNPPSIAIYCGSHDEPCCDTVFQYDSSESRDKAYDRLVEAIREWYE